MCGVVGTVVVDCVVVVTVVVVVDLVVVVVGTTLRGAGVADRQMKTKKDSQNP